MDCRNKLQVMTVSIALLVVGLAYMAPADTISVLHSAYVSADGGAGRALGGYDDVSLYAGSSAYMDRRAVYEFETPSIAGSVTDATFKVYISSETAVQDLYLRSISADGDVTTADYDATVLNAGGLIASNGATCGVYFEYDITDMLNAAIDGNEDYFAVRLEIPTPVFTQDDPRLWNVKGKVHESPPSIEYTVVPRSTISVLHSAYVSSDGGAGRTLAGYDGASLYAGSIAYGDYRAIYEFETPAISGTLTHAGFRVYISSETAVQDLYLRNISADGDVTTADYDATVLDAGGVIAADGATCGVYFEYDITDMLNASINGNEDYFAVRLEIPNPVFTQNDARLWNVKGKVYASPPSIAYIVVPIPAGTLIVIQ